MFAKKIAPTVRTSALIFILALSIQCTPRAPYPAGFAQWIPSQNEALEKDSWDKDSLGRIPATESDGSRPPVCFNDRTYHAAAIRLDIDELEVEANAKNNNRPETRTWNGVNLAEMSPIQARAVLKFRSWIDDVNPGLPSLEGCKHPICILNRVYKQPDDAVIGHQIYWYFLKTGYVIGLSGLRFESIMEDTGFAARPEAECAGTSTPAEDRSYSRFLFTPTEIAALWQISHLLPSQFHNMTSMETVHRIPDCVYVTRVKNSRIGAKTCGLSWGNKDHGTVMLMKPCLTFDEKLSDPEKNDGFQYTIHEFAHSLDRARGTTSTRTEGNTVYFSDLTLAEQPEFLKLSGWRKTTTVGEGGVTYISWDEGDEEHSGGLEPDGFVRDYAKTSPKEDFAESAAAYRMSAPRLKSVSPRKYEYLKKEVYEDREYTRAGLNQYIQQSLERSLTQDLPRLVKGCTEQPAAINSSLPNSEISQLSAWHWPALKDFSSCARTVFLKRAQKHLDRIKAYERGACEILTSSEQELLQQIAKALRPQVDALLGQQESLKELIQNQKNLRQALRKIQPMELWVRSQASENPEDAFRSLLESAFQEVAGPYAAKMDSTSFEVEKVTWIESASYEESKKLTLAVFQGILEKSNAQERWEENAKALWEQCLNSTSSQTENAPPTRPFTGGTRYVPAEILTCLNSRVGTEIQTLLVSILSGLGLSPDPQAQKLLTQLIQPAYLAVLMDQLDLAASEESKNFDKSYPGLVKDALEGISKTPAWWKPGMGPEELKIACSESVASNLTFPPARFSSTDELRGKVAVAACDAVLATWLKTLNEVIEAVAKAAEWQASNCKKNTFAWPQETLKKRLTSCLKENWTKVESFGYAQLKRSAPDRFKEWEESVKRELSNQRSQLQKDAEATLFRR